MRITFIMENVPFEEPADLVGLSVETFAAERFTQPKTLRREYGLKEMRLKSKSRTHTTSRLK
jgi:hypothetical protein